MKFLLLKVKSKASISFQTLIVVYIHLFANESSTFTAGNAFGCRIHKRHALSILGGFVILFNFQVQPQISCKEICYFCHPSVVAGVSISYNKGFWSSNDTSINRPLACIRSYQCQDRVKLLDCFQSNQDHSFSFAPVICLFQRQLRVYITF